mgnify:CR=1 FL=1
MRHVLVLDPSFRPIEVVGWMKAMEILVSGKAIAVEEYDDVTIRSEKQSFRLPSVLKLIKSYTKRRHVKFSRYNIFFRDKFQCQYCGSKPGTEELELEHVIPKCRRTPDSYKSWENIVTACTACNRKKNNRTPEEAGMRLRKQPVKPAWTPAMTIRMRPSDPETWRSYCYWNVELESA